MRADLMRLVGQEAAVVAAAPAGAGKSHFVSATVGRLGRKGCGSRWWPPPTSRFTAWSSGSSSSTRICPWRSSTRQGRDLPAATRGPARRDAADPPLTRRTTGSAGHRHRGQARGRVPARRPGRLRRPGHRRGVPGRRGPLLHGRGRWPLRTFWWGTPASSTRSRRSMTPPSGAAGRRIRSRPRSASCCETTPPRPGASHSRSPGGWTPAQFRSPGASTLGTLSARPSARRSSAPADPPWSGKPGTRGR